MAIWAHMGLYIGDLKAGYGPSQPLGAHMAIWPYGLPGLPDGHMGSQGLPGAHILLLIPYIGGLGGPYGHIWLPELPNGHIGHICHIGHIWPEWPYLVGVYRRGLARPEPWELRMAILAIWAIWAIWAPRAPRSPYPGVNPATGEPIWPYMAILSSQMAIFTDI